MVVSCAPQGRLHAWVPSICVAGALSYVLAADLQGRRVNADQVWLDSDT